MRETRKQEIVRISAQLFKEKGYSAVTMRDIANALDMKAASLYNHIKSKQEILNNIIISLAENFTNGMQEIYSSDNLFIVKLEKIVRMHIQITSDNQAEMASLNNDWMHLEETLDYYLEMRSNYENNFREIIKKGIENKEIIDEDAEIILFSILSTLRSLYLWIPKKEDLKKEDLNEKLTKVLLHGIVLS